MAVAGHVLWRVVEDAHRLLACLHIVLCISCPRLPFQCTAKPGARHLFPIISLTFPRLPGGYLRGVLTCRGGWGMHASPCLAVLPPTEEVIGWMGGECRSLCKEGKGLRCQCTLASASWQICLKKQVREKQKYFGAFHALLHRALPLYLCPTSWCSIGGIAASPWGRGSSKDGIPSYSINSSRWFLLSQEKTVLPSVY